MVVEGDGLAHPLTPRRLQLRAPAQGDLPPAARGALPLQDSPAALPELQSRFRRRLPRRRRRRTAERRSRGARATESPQPEPTGTKEVLT